MPTGTTRRLADHALFATEPALARVEQSNSSVVFRDLSVLKVLRRLEDGPHPEAEVGRLLTENGRYGHSAPFEGALEYRVGERAATVAILFGYVPNEGDAWQVYQRELADLYAAVLARPPEPALDLGTGLLPWQLVGTEPPPALASRAMPGLERARLLGRRTAELHAAFVRPPLPSSFVPQPFTPLYQRALGQSIRNLIAATLRDVEQRRQSMDSPGKAAVDAFVATVPRLGARVEAALAAPLRGRRQRTHGDFHLGQVLVSAGDLVMIDFEGEPNRPLAERRNLASPLRDVAGMLRSFQYAAWAPVLGRPTEEEVDLRPWAEAWARFVGAAFLGSYLEAAQGLGNLLSERDSVEALLEVHLLEKALYEVRYELASRPGWVRIPLAGLLALIGEDLPPSV
jgi:trehalose synthase-fused probable maltokinase